MSEPLKEESVQESGEGAAKGKLGDAEGKAVESPAASAEKPSRMKRWGKRFKAVVVVILLVLVAFRIALQLLFPYVIRRTAAGYGLAAKYERHEIDLFGGDVGIWHLELRPSEGGEALIQAEYCRGDVSTLDLLRGRLVVRRLETEGLKVLIERNANGEIPILKRFAAKPSGPPAALSTSASATPQEIDLSSPLVLDAFRLDHVKTHIRDLSVTPILDAVVETNLRLTDLNSSVRPTRIELEVGAAPALDSLRITGEGTSKGKNLDAKLTIAVRGLHPRQAAGYLHALNIKPFGYNLSADMRVRLKTIASTRPSCVAATASLSDIAVYADGEESVALDSMTIDADALSGAVAEIARIVIDGARCSASRGANGNIRVAGLEFLPARAAAAHAPATAPASPASAASSGVLSHAAPTSQPAAFRWSVAQLSILNAQALVHDLAVSPEANLQLNVESITIDNLLKDPKVPVVLDATLLSPGTARRIKLTGSAFPFASPKTADFHLAIEGIEPTALRPYLDAANVECQIKSGTLACDVHASVSEKAGQTITDAKLSKVRFGDGAELLALDDVHIEGFGMDVLSNVIHVDAVAISGPRLGARRDAGGLLEVLGFRFKHSTKIAAAPAKPAAGTVVVSTTPGPSAAPSAPVPSAFPRVQIGKFAWKGIHMNFEDAGASPVSTFTLEDAGIEVDGLLLDLDPKPGVPATPAQLHAWMKMPGVIGSIEVNGTITPRQEGPVAQLDVNGQGLKGSAVAAYLAGFGIEPTFRDGTFRMKTRISMTQRPDGLAASVSIDALQLQDEGKELLGLDHLDVASIDVRDKLITVEQPVIIDRPRLRAAREKNGALTLAGIRLLAPGAAPKAEPPVAAMVMNGATKAQVVVAAAPAASVLIVRSLRVKDASVLWSDFAAPKPVDVAMTASVDLDDFVSGKAAPPGKLRVVATSPGCLDNLTLTGQFTPDPAAPQAKLNIAATGVRAGSLSPYLPPQLKATLKDGRFHAALDMGVQANPKGGQQGHFFVTDLDYRDGTTGPSLFKLDSMRAVISRLDQPAQVIAVEEFSLAGLETDLHKTTAGPSLLGFLLGEAQGAVAPAPAPAAPAKAAAVIAPAAAALAAVPIVEPAAPALAAVTAADVARVVAQTKRKLPLITIEKLDIAVNRLAIFDETRTGSAPLILSDLHLKNHGRLEMLGDKPEERPPAEINLSCKPAPIAESFRMHIKAAPFALQPTVAIDLTASGIKGDGLLAALPELKRQFDGKELTDGQFAAHLEATIVRIDRQDLMRFDFSHPMDADLLIKGFEFRSIKDGPVLAGVEEIRSDGMHIDPGTGSISAKSVEVNNLTGKVVADTDGIHAVGLILKLPTAASATTQPGTPAVAMTSEAAKPPVVSAAAPTSAPAQAPPEIRVDKFAISGMSFVFEDHSVVPHLVVPITAFDLEVRDFTTLMLTQEKSVRFSLLASAGKVPLPRPVRKTGLIGALAGGAKPDAGADEERELFSQITASGNLSLYPQPKGWVKASLSGLELAALKSKAKTVGVTLSAGTFDSSIDARLHGDGSMDLKPRFVFDELSVAEPAHGFLERILRLPAPLDLVIGALQDASGQITVPLEVPIKKGEINTGSVMTSATLALGGVVLVATASAPAKALNSVTSLAGLNFLGKQKEAPIFPVTANFAPGDATVVLAYSRILDPMLERMKTDTAAEIVIRHELGGGDQERESTRANPSREDAENLAYQLRQKKMALLKMRASLAGQARAELASGLGKTGAIERLRAVDRELAFTENGMDDLYDLLRPGAEHQKDRRTRAACLALGEERLAAVHDLIASASPAIAGRIRVINAQYNPAEDTEGGSITITLSKSK